MILRVRYKANTRPTSSVRNYTLVTTKPTSYALGIHYDNTDYYAQLERAAPSSTRACFYIDGKNFAIATESYDPLAAKTLAWAKTSNSNVSSNKYVDWTKIGNPTLATPGVLYLDGSSGLISPEHTCYNFTATSPSSNYYSSIAMSFYFKLTSVSNLPIHLASFYKSSVYFHALYIDESRHLTYKQNNYATPAAVSMDTVTIQPNKEYFVDLQLHSWDSSSNWFKLTADETTTTINPYDVNTGNGFGDETYYFCLGYAPTFETNTFINSGASFQSCQGYIREASTIYQYKEGSNTGGTQSNFYFGA